MCTKDVVIEILSDITGLDQEEFRGDEEIDLFETGILDSLTVVTLMKDASARLGKTLSFKAMQLEDFRTAASIAEAFDCQ